MRVKPCEPSRKPVGAQGTGETDPFFDFLGWLAIKWWKFCWNHGLITFTLQNYRETMRSAK